MVQYVKVGLLLMFFGAIPVYCQEMGSQLPLWQEGMLDIHHINTGRGDAAFCVLPDGTTLLIDAGDMSETHARTLSARNAKAMPSNSKSAPEWIVDYIKQFHPKKSGAQLDYALITHYHDDHADQVQAAAERFGCPVWATTELVEVLENPGAYHLPALTANPIRQVHGLEDGTRWQWR